jgi:hypothetical protein
MVSITPTVQALRVEDILRSRHSRDHRRKAGTAQDAYCRNVQEPPKTSPAAYPTPSDHPHQTHSHEDVILPPDPPPTLRNHRHDSAKYPPHKPTHTTKSSATPGPGGAGARASVTATRRSGDDSPSASGRHGLPRGPTPVTKGGWRGVERSRWGWHIGVASSITTLAFISTAPQCSHAPPPI